MQKKTFYLLAFITILSTSINAQSYEERFKKCSEPLIALGTNIDSLYFVRLRERDSCLTGSIAPDFEVTSINGQTIKLSDLRGQVVVLNFWFTRCQPCIQEMPALNKLVEHYADKKVQFISFAPEDSSTLLNFFQEHPFNFTAIAKSENIRQSKFRLFSAWPYAIIIDRQGRISKMWSGNPGEKVFDYYQEAIDKLL